MNVFKVRAIPILPRLIRFICELGLTPRLISYMIIVAAVPVVLIGIVSFREGSEGIQSHTKAHLTSIVTVKAQEIERWFRPLEAASGVLASSPTVREKAKLLIKAETSPEAVQARSDLRRYFNGTIQRTTGLQQISLVSPDGHFLFGSTPVVGKYPRAHPLMADQGKPKTQAVLPPYIPGYEVKPAVISVPLVDGETAVAYIVVEASTIPLFETLSPDAGLGPNAKIYLINERGDLLTPFRTLPDRSTIINLHGAITESQDRSGSGLVYTDVAGTEVVGAYNIIEPLGLRVVAELPVSEAYSDIHQMRWAIIGACGAFLVLALAVAYLLTHNVTRPLRILMAGAEIIGRGKLDHRIRINSKDEIGMVARSFNEMAKDLKANIEGRLAERERAEAKLEEQNRELEEASQAKSQVLATVSHELKTPLTGIIGYAHMLLEKQHVVGTLTDTQLRYVDVIRRCSYRLKDLIADLLEVSKIESHSLELGLTDLDIVQEIEEVVGSLKEQFDNKDMAVNLNVPTDLAKVRGDRLRVSQILGNLVSNACKYSPEGASVTVSVQEENSFVRVDVEDQGMGIHQEDQSKLFSKFFRSKEVVNKGISGTGLGLFVVKHLVTAHGGRIWLTSEVGRGTIFSFTLPKVLEEAISPSRPIGVSAS